MKATVLVEFALILKASKGELPPIAPVKVNAPPVPSPPDSIVRLSVPLFPSMVLEKLMSPSS